ncbi:MAG: phospholipid carrier-dependent glycosyltransferase [Armatimonadetes bacterium]|nr:phospholipid carrier-dependent glycosyltransferase [Armatimonadota bacterium]
MSMERGRDVVRAGERLVSWGQGMGLLVLALAVRLWNLGGQSLWVDEVLQFNISREPLWRLVQAVAGGADNSPPVYHTVLHYVIAAGGTSEWALRLPSALFGSTSVVLIYIIARQLGQTRGAPLAGLLLALSPLHVWYSQEARMYSLMVMLVLGQTVVLLRALRHPSWSAWSAYCLLTIVALYTYPYVLLSCLGQGCWLALGQQRRQQALKPWLLATGVAGLSFVPWVLTLLHREDLTAGLEKAVSPAVALGYTALTFIAGYNIGPSVAELHVNRGVSALLPHWPYLAAYGLLGAAGLGATVWHWRRERCSLSLAACMVLWPVLGVLAVSEVMPSITYNVRYALAAVPFLCLGFGVGLGSLRSGPRVVLVIGFIALSGLSLWRGQTLPQYLREDNRAAAAYVAQAGQPGELVLLQASVPFKHYFQRQDILLQAIPRGLSKEERVSLAQRLAREHPSLWLVECRSWTVDASGVMEKTLRQALSVESRMEFAGVRVTHYRR